MRTTIWLLMMALVAPALAASETDALLERFAPVIVQNCAGRADYITKFDYDGNWNGQDNWDNFDRVRELPAVVYTAAIATSTHWYLTYSLFHPRDWWPVTSVPFVNHENDLEGVLVVLEKRADGSPELLLMETISHFHIKRYSNHPAFAGEKLDGVLRTEGEHPIVESEKYKHGLTGWQDADLARAKDAVIYRFKNAAQVPTSDKDRDCGYAFQTVGSTFWARRHEVGPGKMWGEAHDYAQGSFGAKINGDNFGKNKASAPWAWSDKDDKGIALGDWFFNPAHAMKVHYPKNAARFAAAYTQNEFTGDLSARELARTQLFAALE